jgi:hypothetical protein
MPGVLRSLAERSLWAGAVGLALAGPAAADGPEVPTDPIAESNRLTDPFHRPPVIQLMAADAPWLTPAARGPAPLPAATTVQRPPEPLPPQPPPVSMSVNWSAPARRPMVAAPLPTSERPMIPCEPLAPPPPPVAFAPPRMEPPSMPPAPEPLPPPRLAPPAPPPPTSAKRPVMTAAPDDDFHAPRPVTTCRFLDDVGPPKPAADPVDIIAVIRRGGPATGSAVDVRKAVEAACRTKAVECQTEVAGERQVRVLLTVRSETDWQRLYARLQDLPDLGEYGLLFQVRVEKEVK